MGAKISNMDGFGLLVSGVMLVLMIFLVGAVLRFVPGFFSSASNNVTSISDNFFDKAKGLKINQSVLGEKSVKLPFDAKMPSDSLEGEKLVEVRYAFKDKITQNNPDSVLGFYRKDGQPFYVSIATQKEELVFDNVKVLESKKIGNHDIVVVSTALKNLPHNGDFLNQPEVNSEPTDKAYFWQDGDVRYFLEAYRGISDEQLGRLLDSYKKVEL